MGHVNFDTEKFQTPGINDTSKLTEECDKKIQKEDESGKKCTVLCGSEAKPHVFFDPAGCLHIVLYGDLAKDEIEKYRCDKQGGPQNIGKAFPEGKGIYIHTSSSAPVDKVCPCKLLPNDPCSPA